MAAPIIDSVLQDKPTYAPGDLVRLTVTYHDPDTVFFNAAVTLTNPATGQSGTATVQVPVVDPVDSMVTTSGKTWTKVSDDGHQVVFTTVA